MHQGYTAPSHNHESENWYMGIWRYSPRHPKKLLADEVDQAVERYKFLMIHISPLLVRGLHELV